MNTGALPVFLFSSFRFLYVVTVRLMFRSKMLNVGSTPNTQNSFGLVQNWPSCWSWRSFAKTTNKSGWIVHSRMKTFSLHISSSRFARSRRIHMFSKHTGSLIFLNSSWRSVFGMSIFLAVYRALYMSFGPLGSSPKDRAEVTSPTEQYTASSACLTVVLLVLKLSFNFWWVLGSILLYEEFLFEFPWGLTLPISCSSDLKRYWMNVYGIIWFCLSGGEKTILEIIYTYSYWHQNTKLKLLCELSMGKRNNQTAPLGFCRLH